jgi:hypothetical protein
MSKKPNTTNTLVDKTKPDVLRVTEYILEQSKLGKEFSVQSADKSTELNGIGRHKIAQIIRDICLDPNGEGSLITCTTVDNNNLDNTYCRWQLNANTYYSYLSYLSVKESQKSNKTATNALYVAIGSVVLALASIFIAA